MTDSGSVYLLLGPETGEKNEFISRIKDGITKKTGSLPDEYSFYPYDAEVSEIIAILRNIPLFASHILVTVKGCHDIKKKDVPLIIDYIKNPSRESTLILVSDSTKADSSLEKAVPAGSKKVFWEMFDSRKKGWVAQFFRNAGLSADSGAVDFLIDMLEGDTETLKKECSNLALFFGPGSSITEEMISDFFYNRKEENIFTLFEHVAESDFEKALESAAGIILSGESAPVQMLGGLLWQLRNACEYINLLGKKTLPSEAFAKMNIKAKKMQALYSAAAENYKADDMERAISLTASYDLLFRSVKTEIQQLMFPVYLYSLIVCRGRNIDSRTAGFPLRRSP